MPRQKRKAEAVEEEESPPPKKTKKQLREEAKERARQWAEREAKKSGITSPPGKKRNTRALPTRKAAPARTLKKKPASPVQSLQGATKRQKLNSGKASYTKKTTRKQEIAEAKKRAQEWADEQQEKKKSSKKVASPTRAAAAKNDDDDDEASASHPLVGSPPAAAPAPAPVAAQPVYTEQELAFYTAQQQQQALARQQRENAAYQAWEQQRMANLAPAQPTTSPTWTPQQQQAYQQYMLQQARRNAANPYAAAQQQQQWAATHYAGATGGGPYSAAQTFSQPTASASDNTTLQSPSPAAPAAKAPSPTPAETAKEASSPASPTPTTAAKNTKATAKSSPMTVQESTEPDQEETDNTALDGNDVEAEGASASKRFWFLPHSLKILVMPVVAAIVAYLFFAYIHPNGTASDALETVKHPDEPVLPPCFISNPREEEPSFQNCKGHPRPCPKGGRCSTGTLISCTPYYMAVSDGGDQCVASSATNKTLAKVEALLAEWTIEDTCSFVGCSHVAKHPDGDKMRAPFFGVAAVKEEVGFSDDYHILSLSDSFIILSGKGEPVIGLTVDYLDNKLIVPMWCYVGLLVVQGLVLIMSVFLYLATLVTGFGKAFPLATAGCFLFLWAIYVYNSKRKKNAQLRLDVAAVRDVTYGKLARDPSKPHFVLLLRDEVAMELYPTSKTQRAYIIKKVWPRVVADVKLDNRVMKMTGTHRGTERDVWQWTASSTL